MRNRLLAEHLYVEPDEIAGLFSEKGSLVAVINAFDPTGKYLERYEIPDLSEVEKWLADNEILDPEGPEESMEPLQNRGLLRRLKSHIHHRKNDY